MSLFILPSQPYHFQRPQYRKHFDHYNHHGHIFSPCMFDDQAFFDDIFEQDPFFSSFGGLSLHNHWRNDSRLNYKRARDTLESMLFPFTTEAEFFHRQPAPSLRVRSVPPVVPKVITWNGIPIGGGHVDDTPVMKKRNLERHESAKKREVEKVQNIKNIEQHGAHARPAFPEGKDCDPVKIFNDETRQWKDSNLEIKDSRNRPSKQEQLQQAFAWIPDDSYEQLPDPEDDEPLPELEEVIDQSNTDTSVPMDEVSVEDVESDEEDC